MKSEGVVETFSLMIVFFSLHLLPLSLSLSLCLSLSCSLSVSLSLSLSLSLGGHRPGGHAVDRVSVDQIILTLGHPLSAEKELRAGH